MYSLRRIKCGAFNIDDAYTLDQIIETAETGKTESLLLPMDSLFSDLTRYTCSETEESYIRNGRQLKTLLQDGRYTVYSAAGEFLMLAEAENGTLRSRKNFF